MGEFDQAPAQPAAPSNRGSLHHKGCKTVSYVNACLRQLSWNFGLRFGVKYCRRFVGAP